MPKVGLRLGNSSRGGSGFGVHSYGEGGGVFLHLG